MHAHIRVFSSSPTRSAGKPAREVKSHTDTKQMDEIKWVKGSIANYLNVCLCVCVHVCMCARHREKKYVGEERREAESIQDWGSSSLTDCTAMLSQFIAVIPYIFWHFQLCLSHMAGHLFFFLLSTLSSSPSFAILSLSLLPILFQRLHSISFLSGRSPLALCGGPFHMWGSGSPGILLLPGSVADGAGRGQWWRARDRAAEEWKGCCQICQGLPFNLSGDPEGGPHRARFGEWRQTCVFGWLHPSFGSSSWQ